MGIVERRPGLVLAEELGKLAVRRQRVRPELAVRRLAGPELRVRLELEQVGKLVVQRRPVRVADKLAVQRPLVRVAEEPGKLAVQRPRVLEQSKLVEELAVQRRSGPGGLVVDKLVEEPSSRIQIGPELLVGLQRLEPEVVAVLANCRFVRRPRRLLRPQGR